MNTILRPLRARTAVPRALARALQWRLLLLWVLASLGCALIAALPVWTWLGTMFDHSLQSGAIAGGNAPALISDAFSSGTTPTLLFDVLLAPSAPLALITSDARVSTILTLLLSPLLVGAILTSARATVTPRFGDLLRGAIGEYWPLLRLLLWSILPLGAAAMLYGVLTSMGSKANEHAILASSVERWNDFAMVAAGILLVLAHASTEAARGWMAADPNLRSAIKAWWRGAVLLVRRPIAVLSACLVTWLLAIALALLMLALRQRLGGGLAAGLLFSCLISGALAWGKVARLFALHALAADRRHGRG